MSERATERDRPGGTRAVCSIITKPFLAHARTLAASLKAHHPEVRFIVLLADRADGTFDPAAEPFEMISLDDLGNREAVARMCFYYTPFELCCALRGLLHRYMQERTQARAWLQLDADTMVWGDLSPVFEAVERASVTLTPHLLAPDDDYRNRPETLVSRFGMFNAGCVGVSRDAGKPFIDWFVERLELFCFRDSFGGFVDQRWLTFVPIFFKDASVLHHPGVNIAYWNLHERRLTTDDNGGYLVNGMPLLLTHFSSVPIEAAAAVGSHSLWEAIVARYTAELHRNGYAQARGYAYAFDLFDDGRRITPLMRRSYYALLRSGAAGERNPFAARSWLRRQQIGVAWRKLLTALSPTALAQLPRRLRRVIAASATDAARRP